MKDGDKSITSIQQALESPDASVIISIGCNNHNCDFSKVDPKVAITPISQYYDFLDESENFLQWKSWK